MHLNRVECVGTESRLSACPHPGVGMIGTCSGHSEDAGLRCSEGNEMDNLIKVQQYITNLGIRVYIFTYLANQFHCFLWKNTFLCITK